MRVSFKSGQHLQKVKVMYMHAYPTGIFLTVLIALARCAPLPFHHRLFFSCDEQSLPDLPCLKQKSFFAEHFHGKRGIGDYRRPPARKRFKRRQAERLLYQIHISMRAFRSSLSQDPVVKYNEYIRQLPSPLFHLFFDKRIKHRRLIFINAGD